MPPINTIVGFTTNKPLSDPSLPSSPVSLNLPAQSTAINIPDSANPGGSLGGFNISVGASTSVAIVNSDSDPDPMGFFNLEGEVEPAAQNPGDAPLIEPPVTFDPALAYVVITGIAVSGKLSGNFTIGANGALGLDGSAALDASVCTAFAKDTMAWEAVTAAANQFKTIFSLADLQAVPPGTGPVPFQSQIMCFGVQTELSLALTLSASSLSASLAASLNSVLNQVGPFRFKSTPAASITLSAGATDGYRIFAQRSAGATTFSVKKSLSQSLGLDGGLGLSIAVTDSEITGLVSSAIDQVTGVAEGTIQSFLGAGNGAGLAASQLQALHGIVTKLGLAGGGGSELSGLQAKVAALKDDLLKRLVLTVRAQFTYSWKRLTTESLLARFTVPDAVLPKYHADILALNISRLMHAPAEDGVTLDRFLGQLVRQIDVGYGFSFGVGSHVFLKSWDSLETKFVELDTIAASGGLLRQFSFLGKRGYDATWMNTTQSHYVELDASMPTPLAAPSSADFQVGLSIAFLWKNQRFGTILPAVADYGAVVKAFETDDVAAAAQSLVAAGLPPDATGDALVTLSVTDGVLRQLLPILTGPDYRGKIAPNAMARALPYAADYKERSLVDRRMAVYGQIWADFLSTEDLSNDTLLTICRAELPRVTNGGQVAPNLLFGEESPGASWSVQSVGQMASQEDLQDAVLRQASGCFALLQQRSADFHQLFPDCVADLSDLAAQSFGSRILASMLIIAGMLTPGGLRRIARSVELSWVEDGVQQVVAIKQGVS